MTQPSHSRAKLTEDQIKDMFARLSSTRADAAWKEFLEGYSSFILHLVRQYESDPGRATDCFLYVCGQLSDNGFRRLLRYRPDGPARLRTWLTAVATNLCIDWRRKQHGRFRPIQAVAGLPELDQLVYRFIYVRGMTREECLRVLEPRFPDLTDQKLSEVNAQLFSLLTPVQRWQASRRAAETIPLEEAAQADQDEPTLQVEEPGAGPDVLAQMEQERSMIEAAMSRLPPRQRLLLRLRYQQDLTLDEIARITRLSDPFRAKRQIQAALAALGEQLKS